MWRRLTIPVVLSADQAAAADLCDRSTLLPDARVRPRGVRTRQLGVLPFAGGLVVFCLRPRTVRLVRTGQGYAVECTSRSLMSVLTPLRLILAVMAVLSGGVALSALTTRDRTWWSEAFSNLGAFDDFSSLVFNGTLVVAGVGTCLFAYRLASDLRRLRRRGILGAAAHVIPVLVCVAGVALALVGIFTESANREVHDLVASTLALLFAALLLCTPPLLRALPTTVTVTCGVFLAASASMLLAGRMTLAAFELLTFVLFFLWLCTTSRAVGGLLRSKEPRR